MPGKIPIVQLPRGVEGRAPSNPFWDALTSGADQGMDPTTQAIAAAVQPPPRRTTDIQLNPEVAPPPMFTDASRGLESARSPVEAPSLPPEIAERMAIRAGFKIPDGIDWASERAGFLAQGNADREAMEAEEQRQGLASIWPGARTSEDSMRSNVIFRQLQRARDMADPDFQRDQREQDAFAEAETYADPRMVKHRGARREDMLADKAGLAELGLMFGNDPRALAAEQRKYGHQRGLADIEARGRMGFMGALGQQNSPAPRGTATLRDVQEFARTNGMTVEQALAAFEAEGYAVSQ